MEKHKKSYKNNKFKLSVLTWNDKLELPDKSYFLSDIKYYFGYISNKEKTLTDSPPIKLHMNQIEKRITFKTNSGYYLGLLTPQTMKLLETLINEELKKT